MERTGFVPARAMRASVSSAVLLAALVSPADAQRGATVTMREKVYEELSRAQELATKEQFVDALDALSRVENMRDLEPYEKAQLYTTFGYVYFSQERLEESIAAYAKVLEQDGLPEVLASSTRYTLAQLHFHTGAYEASIEHLSRWLTGAENPGPEPFVLLGQAYHELDRTEEAVAPTERAVVIARERGQPVREEWYGLLRVLYHELEDRPKLLGVLERLVSEYPKKDYWLHLAAVYGQSGDAGRQLAAYEIAYRQGFLTRDSEIRALSQLLLQAGVPYRAGVVLAKGLADGRVEDGAETLDLLSQAWMLAREDARAIDALSRAAALSADGEIDARLARSYANLDRWDDAIQAARRAIRKGVRAPHDMHILAGMALFEIERYEDARAAFRVAAALPAGRELAGKWLRFVDGEVRRLRELQRVVE